MDWWMDKVRVLEDVWHNDSQESTIDSTRNAWHLIASRLQNVIQPIRGIPQGAWTVNTMKDFWNFQKVCISFFLYISSFTSTTAVCPSSTPEPMRPFCT